MKQKAINIIWDVDNETDLDYLPKEIDIPVNIMNIDDISDYISNYTGFCHKGFEMVYQVFKNEIFTTLDEIKNLYMIQNQIKYKGELIFILNKKGAKYIFSDQKYIDEKEIWYTECVPFKYHNHYISLYKYFLKKEAS